jgi:UDP-N-acetylmuramoylalanine--D-glutamate ligase
VPFAREPDEPRLATTIFGRLPQRENYQLVRAFWRQRGLPEEQLVAAALSFQVGAHRLARVGEARGVSFWNDSKATNFHAVEAALASFPAPVLWIGGGRSKGGDFAAFAARIAPRLRRAFLIGETREALARHLREQAVPVALCESLRDAVTQAFAAAARGDAVLLSPAFASFDMFKGYDDRGRCFEAIVAELTGASGTASRATPTSPAPHNPNRPAAAGLCLLCNS